MADRPDLQELVFYAQAGRPCVKVSDAERLLKVIDEQDRKIERLQKERKQVESYLAALATCSRLHPNGYTIVDFQQVWLDQKDAEIARLREENEVLRSQAGRGIHEITKEYFEQAEAAEAEGGKP